MSKRIGIAIVAIIAVGAFASTASATNARLNAMGAGSIAGATKSFTVLDERNIFALPAELVKYGSWTGLELLEACIQAHQSYCCLCFALWRLQALFHALPPSLPLRSFFSRLAMIYFRARLGHFPADYCLCPHFSAAMSCDVG